MSSRSSLQRSSLSSVRSLNKDVITSKLSNTNDGSGNENNKVNTDVGGSIGNSSNEKDDRRPSTAWSIWSSRRDSTTKSDHQPSEPMNGQDSWWRKPSIISLTPFSKLGANAESTNHTSNEQQEHPSALKRKTSNQQINDSNEPVQKRSWSFWNKKDEPQEVMRSKTSSLVSNEVIAGDSYDAILFKTKSEEQTSKETDLENSNEAHGHNSNLLVPSFDTLPSSTILTSIGSYLNKFERAWHIPGFKPAEPRHLFRQEANISLNKLSDGKTRPVKVLIVGLHGFFPTKMIRPIIGEPTGTSTKFISEAEKSVLRWFHRNKTPIEISKIALEKEGKVFDRVDFFYEVLQKWISEINKADFVYFVAHSQGCPVTIILLAKLIEAGIIEVDNVLPPDNAPMAFSKGRKKKVVCVLAMAGINNGPFYGADQTFFVKAYSAIESDSLSELFEFQNFHSVQSQKYIQSLRICIASNVKICFVGSINDQLVPLYSSTCQFAHHPNIFKATFVDKDSKTPAFITRIVSIANNLINLGYDDHGIIKEISGSLAGTLTGGGHSKIYDEGQVYELGIKFALETTDLPLDIPVKYRHYEVDQLGSNPYHLPWCMRGLLYETGVHLDRSGIDSLFKEFEEWEPETKQLKNVKYRLNGLKSKL